LESHFFTIETSDFCRAFREDDFYILERMPKIKTCQSQKHFVNCHFFAIETPTVEKVLRLP